MPQAYEASGFHLRVDFKIEVKDTHFNLEVISLEVVMTLFRLDASIRTDGSASREIADIVEAEWLAAYPAETIERRHIGQGQIEQDAVHIGVWIAPNRGETRFHDEELMADETRPAEHARIRRALAQPR